MFSRISNVFHEYKIYALIVFLFFFLYILNMLTPFYSGDDYLYSFVWNNHNMFEPLPENATRITSVGQWIHSAISHYRTWSGRLGCHSLYFLFAWKGKDFFNLCNALVTVSFLVLLVKLSRRRDLTRNLPPVFLLLAFFGIWMFNADVPSTIFWMGGALNYIWPSFFFLVLSRYYIQEYYSPGTVYFRPAGLYCIFFFSLFIGMTHESLSSLALWFYLWLMFFIYREMQYVPDWFLAGYTGLFIGFLFEFFSSGNYMRLLHEASYRLYEMASNYYSADLMDFVHLRKAFYEFVVSGSGSGFWFLNITSDLLASNLVYLWFVYKMELVLWFYILLVMNRLKNIELDTYCKKDIRLVKILLSCTAISYLMFLLLPIVSLRISFFGLVFLVWAFLIIARLSWVYDVFVFKKAKVRYCVKLYCTVLFIISLLSGFYCFYDMKSKEVALVLRASSLPPGSVFEVKKEWLKPCTFFSGLPFLNSLELSPMPLRNNENDWMNVTFARYHNLKAVKIVD